jgi:hypothetical protein
MIVPFSDPVSRFLEFLFVFDNESQRICFLLVNLKAGLRCAFSPRENYSQSGSDCRQPVSILSLVG